MKGKKDVKKPKQGRPAKELLPQGFGKAPREGMLPVVEGGEGELSYEFEVSPMCPAWPGDEAALSYDFGLSSSSVFEDDWEYFFPPSFMDFAGGQIEWRWPEEVCQINEIHSRFSKRYTQRHSLAHQNTVTISNADGGQVEISVDEAEKLMAVVTTLERNETDEEFEARKAKEMEKLAAQKGKKGKVEEPLPGKIKEVKLGNIEMGKALSHYAKWLSSQLQIIKDLKWKDKINGSPIWSKIYPQKDGMPVYNPSGKYWVKMYSYGVLCKVEIDARVPINHEGNILLPRSSTIRDLWPMILSKAFFKLQTPRWKNISKYIKNPDEEMDGSFFYALTGMLPQQFTYEMIEPGDWAFLTQYFTPDSWEQKRFVVSVHCRLDRLPYIPSMSISDTSMDKEESKEERRSRKYSVDKKEDKRSMRSPTIVFSNVNPLQVSTSRHYSFRLQARPCHVIPGFGYLLFELFANHENFDMKKILRKEQIKNAEDAKAALIKAKATSPARKLKRHQSPARLREYQKRKQRRDKEKEERRHRLLEPKQFQVYRLFKIKTSVTNVPVLNIEAPFSIDEIEEAKIRLLNHDFFLHHELQLLEKLMEKEDIELFNPGDSNIEDFKIDDEEPIDLSTLVQPQQREKGGIWVSSEDFPYAFQEYIVYHDLTYYPHNLVLDDIWKDRKQPYIHNDNFDVWVVNATDTSLEMLVGFSPLLFENLKFQPDHIHFTLQHYDFETDQVLNTLSNCKLVTTSVLAKHFLLPEGSYALKPSYSYCPCGSVTWVSSTHPVQTMSLLQFLTERKGWVHTTLSFTYSSFSKKCVLIPLKADLTTEESAEAIFKLSGSDSNLFECAQLLLIERDSDQYERPSKTIDITTPSKIAINNTSYRLLLQVFPQYTGQDGSLTLEMVSKSDSVKLAASDLLDPIEYSDKYVPNKYGLIFKEHLFTSDDTHFTIHVRVRKLNSMPQSKGKDVPIEELPTASRLIILELYEEDTLVCSSKGFNQAFLQHVNIDHSTSGLLLVCRYDLREWADAKLVSEDTENLNWVLRVISNDTVAVVKNTKKEDGEEAIRKGWETNQPGRAEMAKTTRARYLASVKPIEELTEQEQDLLKETWEERRKNRKDMDASGKNKAKGKEEKKKETEKVEEEPESPEEKHVIHQIKDFLDHTKKDRLKMIGDDEETLFTEDDASQTNLKLNEKIEESSQFYQEKRAELMNFKDKNDEQKAYLKNLSSKFAEVHSNTAEKYRENRNAYQSRFEEKKENSNKLQTAITANDLNAIEVALSEIETSQCDPRLLRQANDLLYKLRISKTLERIKKALNDNNIEEMQACVEQVNSYDIVHEIDFRLVNKAKLLIERFESEKKEEDNT